MNALNKYLVFVITLMICSPSIWGQRVYLSESSRYPFERTITIDSKDATFRYTAFYSGSTEPEEDIHIEFSVDNAKGDDYNDKAGTRYEILPIESYSLNLKTAVIKKGSVSAPSGEARIINTKKLKSFKKYLLPITVKVMGGTVEAAPDLSTIYYVIQPIPTPESIQQKRISQLPHGTISVFGFRDRFLITVNEEGELASYQYSGGNIGKPKSIEGSEYLTGLDNIINFKDHHLIGLERKVNEGQLWSFPISTDSRTISPRDKVFGTAGYASFSNIFAFENNLYCLTPSGELKLYPLSDSMKWGPHPVRSLGSGWDYPIFFRYKKSLVAIDENGNMWEYPIRSGGQLGLPKKTGAGWNAYDKVIAIGNDLLGIDKAGIIWQIKLNHQANTPP